MSCLPVMHQDWRSCFQAQKIMPPEAWHIVLHVGMTFHGWITWRHDNMPMETWLHACGDMTSCLWRHDLWREAECITHRHDRKLEAWSLCLEAWSLCGSWRQDFMPRCNAKLLKAWHFAGSMKSIVQFVMPPCNVMPYLETWHHASGGKTSCLQMRLA